jgi:hypothetical protein
MSSTTGAVAAVFDFRGDPVELAARYDVAVRRVAEVSSARPVIHLAMPREYGLMVVDVWSSLAALEAFESNEEFRRVLHESGLPEPELRIYPVHNLGWPVDAMPIYR